MKIDELCNGAVSSMLSRNPFGIGEREWPRIDRENKMGMFDAVRHVRRIDVESDARRLPHSKGGDPQQYET